MTDVDTHEFNVRFEEVAFLQLDRDSMVLECLEHNDVVCVQVQLVLQGCDIGLSDPPFFIFGTRHLAASP